MTSKLLNKSQILFTIITGLGLLLAIVFSIFSESVKYIDLHFAWVFLLAVFLGILLIVIYNGFVKLLLKLKKDWQVVVILILSAACIRLSWILLIHTPVLSDFDFYYTFAKQAALGNYTDYHVSCLVFPHRIGFPMVLSLVFRLLGTSILTAQLFNVLCSVLATYLVFIITREIFTKKVAIYAALIFIFWPAQIMYTSVVASEHIFTVFILAFIYWMIKGLKASSKAFVMIYFTLSGVALACGQYIRPIALVIAIAIVMVLVIYYGFKAWQTLIISLVFMFIGFYLAFLPMTVITEALTELNLRDTSSGYSLLVGMNQESEGRYNLADDAILFTYDFEMEAVHQAAFDIAVERMTRNPIDTVDLMFKKYASMWGGDLFGYQWSIDQLPTDNFLSTYVISHPGLLRLISHLYYQIVLFMGLYGIIRLWKKPSNISLVFIELLFLSQVGLHLFIEVQPRYHIFGVVMIFIIAAFSFGEAEEQLNEKIISPKIRTIGSRASLILAFGILLTSLVFIGIGLFNQFVHKEIPTIETDGYLETTEPVYQMSHEYLAVYLPLEYGVYRIVFSPCGANNIYAISDVHFNHYKIESDERFIVGTDFLSPYMVKAIDGAEMESHFTGGWHDTIGDGTGEPTASTTQVDIVVEGETTKHSFEKIIITVTNEIQGYNSADTALKEVVTYTIWDQFIEVQVDTEAVQDVEISRYYGLQTQNAVWNDTVTYVYMDGSEETYDMVNNSFARIKGENVVDYYVVADKSGRYLKVDLYNQGLGDFQAISNDQYTAFTMHYPKTYYNIINGEPVILNVGDSFTIQGIYEFGFKK